MRLKIPVTELRLGMYIDTFEAKWLDHPFWKTRFLLEKPEELQTILASPVKLVWIDTDKGLSPVEHDVTPGLQELQPDVEAAIEETPEDKPAKTSAEQEIGKAKEIIDRAKPVMKELFEDVRLGNVVDMESCLPIVDEVSQSVMRNASALTGLLRLKSQDEYSYMHSVAVCTLMAALAIEMGLSEAEVKLAGLAGLMHDLGKAMMPLEVLNKPGKLTDDEFAIMRTHPELGHKALQTIEGMPEEVLDVCLHHHEKFNGTGYPHKLEGLDIPLLTRMGAVCDVYDAVTSERPYKSPWQASDALSRMLSWQGHFDQEILKHFIRCVGIYPMGSLVLLASGKLAVVVEQNPNQLVKPVVKVFYSTKSKVALKVEEVNLAVLVRGEPVDRILNRENPADWGITEERVQSLWVSV